MKLSGVKSPEMITEEQLLEQIDLRSITKPFPNYLEILVSSGVEVWGSGSTSFKSQERKIQQASVRRCDQEHGGHVMKPPRRKVGKVKWMVFE